MCPCSHSGEAGPTGHIHSHELGSHHRISSETMDEKLTTFNPTHMGDITRGSGQSLEVRRHIIPIHFFLIQVYHSWHFRSQVELGSSVEGTKHYQEAPANNSHYLTVFLLVSTMIGSGILNMPEVFSPFYRHILLRVACLFKSYIAICIEKQTSILSLRIYMNKILNNHSCVYKSTLYAGSLFFMLV